jgi:mRNA interferase RelE/StbE
VEYKLVVDRQVLKELADPKNYPAKVYRQITLKAWSLVLDPRPPDYKPVGEGYRVDSGEHRIYYEIDNRERIVTIRAIGKRNDDELYRKLKRKFGN